MPKTQKSIMYKNFVLKTHFQPLLGPLLEIGWMGAQIWVYKQKLWGATPLGLRPAVSPSLSLSPLPSHGNPSSCLTQHQLPGRPPESGAEGDRRSRKGMPARPSLQAPTPAASGTHQGPAASRRASPTASLARGSHFFWEASCTPSGRRGSTPAQRLGGGSPGCR